MIDKNLWLGAAEIIPGFHNRPGMAALYDMFAFSHLHVEIGSYCGRSLFASCGGMTGSQVYAVEPFVIHEAAQYQVVCPRWRRTVLLATLSLLNHRMAGAVVASLLEMPSKEAALRFGHGKVDSVYIDGDHGYDECRNDIERWLPRLRPGGLLAGHDYATFFPGVMYAVNDVLGRENVRFVGPCPIWYYRKPEK